ncbi:hypothetical protein GH733_014439 [Mirounga leonina]|nr:hypothetical protein GH733_014439 [Mirounga leonina]
MANQHQTVDQLQVSSAKEVPSMEREKQQGISPTESNVGSRGRKPEKPGTDLQNSITLVLLSCGFSLDSAHGRYRLELEDKRSTVDARHAPLLTLLSAAGKSLPGFQLIAVTWLSLTCKGDRKVQKGAEGAEEKKKKFPTVSETLKKKQKNSAEFNATFVKLNKASATMLRIVKPLGLSCNMVFTVTPIIYIGIILFLIELIINFSVDVLSLDLFFDMWLLSFHAVSALDNGHPRLWAAGHTRVLRGQASCDFVEYFHQIKQFPEILELGKENQEKQKEAQNCALNRHKQSGIGVISPSFRPMFGPEEKYSFIETQTIHNSHLPVKHLLLPPKLLLHLPSLLDCLGDSIMTEKEGQSLKTKGKVQSWSGPKPGVAAAAAAMMALLGSPNIHNTKNTEWEFEESPITKTRYWDNQINRDHDALPFLYIQLAAQALWVTFEMSRLPTEESIKTFLDLSSGTHCFIERRPQRCQQHQLSCLCAVREFLGPCSTRTHHSASHLLLPSEVLCFSWKILDHTDVLNITDILNTLAPREKDTECVEMQHPPIGQAEPYATGTPEEMYELSTRLLDQSLKGVAHFQQRGLAAPPSAEPHAPAARH